MHTNKIRVIAICLFRHQGRLLVAEGWDPVKPQHFYRPVGGGVEFGESSAVAVAREIREELGAEVVDLRYLGTLENIFMHRGLPGHEIVFVYDGAFADASRYEQEQMMIEENGLTFTALWKPLADFGPDGPPLYPDGLPELLGLRER